jgi:hypothetical protein
MSSSTSVYCLLSIISGLYWLNVFSPFLLNTVFPFKFVSIINFMASIVWLNLLLLVHHVTLFPLNFNPCSCSCSSILVLPHSNNNVCMCARARCKFSSKLFNINDSALHINFSPQHLYRACVCRHSLTISPG